MGNSRDKKLYEKTKHTITGWFNVHYKRIQSRQRQKYGIDLSFDRWDLERWVIEEKYDEFVRLFKEWRDSGYEKMLVPSIDRIDCMRGYTFDNMQIITWQQNAEKYNEEEREKYGLNTCEQMQKATRKGVRQIKDGKVVKEYISLSEASRETGISTSVICECCKGKRRSGKGYRWIYV